MVLNNYLQLHQQITRLAYTRTGEWEEARDIASEYLILSWQKEEDEQLLTPDFYKPAEIAELCDAVRQQSAKRRLSEDRFVQEQMVNTPAYCFYWVADVEAILHLTQLLPPLEQKVIRLILVNGLDLPDISQLLNRKMAAIKIIRDRATIQLEKLYRGNTL